MLSAARNTPQAYEPTSPSCFQAKLTWLCHTWGPALRRCWGRDLHAGPQTVTSAPASAASGALHRLSPSRLSTCHTRTCAHTTAHTYAHGACTHRCTQARAHRLTHTGSHTHRCVHTQVRTHRRVHRDTHSHPEHVDTSPAVPQWALGSREGHRVNGALSTHTALYVFRNGLTCMNSFEEPTIDKKS